MTDQRVLYCLRATMEDDRKRYRSARTRLAFATGDLVHSLRVWTDEQEPGSRAYERSYAWRKLRDVRKARKNASTLARMVQDSSEQYREALRGLRRAA